MGLFDKIKGPVFLKEDSSAQRQIQQLKEIRSQFPEKIQGQIDQELKIVSAGIYGEQNIAFELKNSRIPMLILHDLYLESGDLAAQIDYLIVTRKRSFVLECKNLIGNIEITADGDFIRSFSLGRYSQKEGVYSPITQNQRHLELIKRLLREQKDNFISRALLESRFYDRYRSVVVLANPKTILYAKYAPKEIKSQVIRADQLLAYIERINEEPGADSISEKTMQQTAAYFLSHHREKIVDVSQRYKKLLRAVPPQAPKSQTAQPLPVKKVMLCPKCGAPMIKRRAARGEFKGQEFWGCSQYPICKQIVNISG